MKSTKKLLFGKTLLIAFVSTILITVLLVYLTGLTSHRSVLDNSLISLTVLAIFFFLFLAVGLYNGLNVFDNYSHKLQLYWKNAHRQTPDLFGSNLPNIDAPDVDNDLGEIVIGIVLWVVFSILLIGLLIALQAVLWFTIVLVAAAIYWIFIRGLKLIFSKSPECESNLPKSVVYATSYTILYIGWIYGVIYASTVF